MPEREARGNAAILHLHEQVARSERQSWEQAGQVRRVG